MTDTVKAAISALDITVTYDCPSAMEEIDFWKNNFVKVNASRMAALSLLTTAKLSEGVDVENTVDVLMQAGLSNLDAQIGARTLAAQGLLGKTVPEWMPIETAPRDGTLILAAEKTPHSGKYVRHLMWYVAEKQMELSEESHLFDYNADENFAPAGFYKETQDEEMFYLSHPDYWQPIAAAPKPTDVRGEG